MITANLNYQGDPKYKKLIEASVADMVTVLNHPRFLEVLTEELMDSMDWTRNELKGELSSWANKVPAVILGQLFIDGVLRLNVRTYYSPKRVIGFGVASDDWINVNTKYLKNYSHEDPHDRKAVGSNCLHEEFHNRGMSHDFKNTARRKHSVAYISNRAYERAYDEIIIANLPKPQQKPAPKVYKKPWWRIW
jgi:plasmid maintenance system antidote protein VapI